MIELPTPPDAIDEDDATPKRLNVWRYLVNQAFRELQYAVFETVTESTVYPPDRPPATADATDDEFTGTTLDAKWTFDNQGSPGVTMTATVGDSFLRLNHTADTGICSIMQVAPAGDWTYRAKLHFDYDMTVGGKQSFGFTITCNTAGARLLRFELVMDSTAGEYKIRGTKWYADRETFDNEPSANGRPLPMNAPVYMEVENSSGIIYLRWSTSGFDNFHELLSISHADIWDPAGADIFTPDNIGLGMSDTNSEPCLGVCDWFRRVA